MGRSLGWKIAAIVALNVLLLIGILWIGSIVSERQARRLAQMRGKKVTDLGHMHPRQQVRIAGDGEAWRQLPLYPC